MADDVCEGIENVLNIIVSITDRSGNMKKELKQTIFETISTLRKLIVKLADRNSETSAISKLEAQVSKMKAELDACRGRNTGTWSAISYQTSKTSWDDREGHGTIWQQGPETLLGSPRM
jgi:hypothetical protein